jgi:hypothetical protein
MQKSRLIQAKPLALAKSLFSAILAASPEFTNTG